MGKSIRSAKVEAATFSLGVSYTGETGATPTSLIDVGLTSGGTRISQELEVVSYVSEQLRGEYGSAMSRKRMRVRVELDQLNIYNIAYAWAYGASDVVSSSVLELDSTVLTEKGVRLATTTTKDTGDGTNGVRNIDLWRVAQIENSEINLTIEAMARAPLALACYVDKNDKFGEIAQAKAETVPA